LSERHPFPDTGPRAASHADARRLARRAQDLLDDVHAQKRQAALKDPFGDTNAENARKARAKKYSDGSVPGLHTWRQ
jgi:hypothetical protein